MSCNIGNEYIDYSKKCIKNYIKKILDKKYNEQITNSLVEEYISIRYYNYYKQISKNTEANINYYLKEKALNLKDNKENDEDTINYTYRVFKYILYLDSVKEINIKPLINDIDKFRKVELNINDDFIIEFTKIVEKNLKEKEKFLTSFSTNEFALDYQKTNIANVYNIILNYHLKFPKIYSNYAINKTFNSNIINEDKLFIEYYLITEYIIEQVINSNFDNYFLVDTCLSLCKKKDKNNRLFNIINNDIIKEMLILKINYKEFVKNREIIKGNIKEGYHYAVIINDDNLLKPTNISSLKLFKYIIISKESKLVKELKENNNVILL